MPPPNTLNCLILESKSSLKDLPTGIQYYFVNSKRRFFVYFKQLDQMIEAMRFFSFHNIKFYRRESLLPDREELEELVYHCNYRFKKQDLRKNLYHSTPYNEPKVHFEKYQKIKQVQQNQTENQGQVFPENKQSEQKPIMQENRPEEVQEKESDEKRFKNPEIQQILKNKELLKQVFERMNVGFNDL